MIFVSHKPKKYINTLFFVIQMLRISFYMRYSYPGLVYVWHGREVRYLIIFVFDKLIISSNSSENLSVVTLTFTLEVMRYFF